MEKEYTLKFNHNKWKGSFTDKQLTEMATNLDVIEMFVMNTFPKNKKPIWGTKNLKITKEDIGWSLINYNTPLLFRDDSGALYFNTQKYSVSTSTIQNQIKRTLDNYGISFIEVNEREIHTAIS